MVFDSYAASNQTGDNQKEVDDLLPQANVLVQTVIENNCEPRYICEKLQVEDLFETQVFTVKNDNPRALGIFPASEEGRTIELPSDPNMATYYYVRELADKLNPSLHPWLVEDRKYTSGCTSTIDAGINKTCTIINYLVTKNSTVAHLKVVNHISNDCDPKITCSNIGADELFSNRVVAFLGNIGSPYKDEMTFPGSEDGWMINLFPESNQVPIQYDVKQTLEANSGVVPEFIPLNVSYSDKCHGSLVGGEINVCTITSVFSEGKQSISKLKVITKIHNVTDNCIPSRLSCLDFQPDAFFSANIYTLKDNVYEKELAIPASESGWIVDLVPGPKKGTVQYNVKQQMTQEISKLLSEDMVPHVSYSPECQGAIERGESHICTIDNYFVKG